MFLIEDPTQLLIINDINRDNSIQLNNEMSHFSCNLSFFLQRVQFLLTNSNIDRSYLLISTS